MAPLLGWDGDRMGGELAAPEDVARRCVAEREVIASPAQEEHSPGQIRTAATRSLLALPTRRIQSLVSLTARPRGCAGC